MEMTVRFDSLHDMQEFCKAFAPLHNTQTEGALNPHSAKIAAALQAKAQAELQAQASSGGVGKSTAEKPKDTAKSEKEKPATEAVDVDDSKAAFEECKTLIPALTKLKGRMFVEQILKEGFGAARLGEVAQDRLVELVGVLKKSLPAAE